MGAILIVDDSPDELASLRAILGHDGHEVHSITEGELAQEAAERNRPDLILLDIVLQGIDGFEICRRLKHNPQTAGIPVLFLSGLDDPSHKVRAFEAGGVDYITKPFYLAEIRARVRTQLALQEALARLEAQNAELREAGKLQTDVELMLRHDLRVSLAAVIGFSELIAEELHPAHASATHARIIARAGYSMLSMVHGSFDLLKMERGAYVLQPEVFDVAAVARQVVAEHSLSAREKEVRVKLDFGEECADDALVSGEALLTHSLLQNLFRNALEAAPQGSEIRFHFCMTDGQTEVRLRNAGEVPQAVRGRFFERYATAGKAGGRGVGTYSARLMAETQHGSLQLDTSEPGHTTLAVVLPAPTPDEQEAFRTRRDGEPRSAAGRSDGPGQPAPKVLVLEDDPANRAYFRRILRGLSLELRVARDGAEALELLRQETFAAALVDLETAGLQGLAVAGAFRQWQREQAEAEPGTVFLGLVATADAGVRERCVEAGFERVLVKPISRRRLQEELLNALQPGRQVVQLDVAIRDLIPDFLLGQQTILDECEALLAAGEGGLARALTQRLQCRFAMHGFVTAAQLSAQAHAATRAQRLTEAAEKLRELRVHLLELEIRYA
ncbi:MAG: response regulator [Verrucomicrobia bacterium]|nr:response regulator [Verrucomicrobiota bacterium]